MKLTDIPYSNHLTSQGQDLVSAILNEFDIVTKADFSQIKSEFEQARKVAVGYTADGNAINYRDDRFKIEDQEELTVFMRKGKVISFSSIWSRPQYPANAYRIFSRTWKCPSTRNEIHPYRLFRPMRALQVAYAKHHNLPFVFMTMGGRRQKIFDSWLENSEENWIQHPEMIKVCKGTYRDCWQSCIYLDLQPNSIINEFDSINYDEWKERVLDKS